MMIDQHPPAGFPYCEFDLLNWKTVGLEKFEIFSVCRRWSVKFSRKNRKLLGKFHRFLLNAESFKKKS